MAQLTMTRALATLTAAVAITSGACGGSNESAPPQTPASTTTTTGAPMTGTEAVDHTDAHIAALLTAANQTESNQAQQAIKRSTAPRVRDLAQRMLADRAAAERDQQSVLATSGISPMADEKSDMLRARGEIAITNLGLVGEPDFDKTFLDTAVREQQFLLTTLDNQLIPVAQDSEVKAMLERTRAKVAEDLATARDIQASLPK